MNISLTTTEKFETRHQGKSEKEIANMCKEIGVGSVDELIDQTIPENIRYKMPMNVVGALSESEFLNKIKVLGSKNKVFKSFIGSGYSDTVVPNVVLRNILENPAWYTAYTPYQAEIAQGVLRCCSISKLLSLI